MGYDPMYQAGMDQAYHHWMQDKFRDVGWRRNNANKGMSAKTMPISPVKEYTLIFLAGALWDAILSLDTIFTSHFNSTGVFLSTITMTLLPYALLERILENGKTNWSKAITLALGSGCGALVATEILKRYY